MSDTHVYLSSGWRDEALRRLQSEIPPEKMNNITTSMSNIYKNCPDGVEKFLFIECIDGKVTRVETGESEAPEAEFKITGDSDSPVSTRVTFPSMHSMNRNFTRVETGESEAPEAEFKITGDYETFAKISRAELGSQKALFLGKLKLKGNMAKALKLAALADRINKVLSQIPAKY